MAKRKRHTKGGRRYLAETFDHFCETEGYGLLPSDLPANERNTARCFFYAGAIHMWSLMIANYADPKKVREMCKEQLAHEGVHVPQDRLLDEEWQAYRDMLISDGATSDMIRNAEAMFKTGSHTVFRVILAEGGGQTGRVQRISDITREIEDFKFPKKIQ